MSIKILRLLNNIKNKNIKKIRISFLFRKKNKNINNIRVMIFTALRAVYKN